MKNSCHALPFIKSFLLAICVLLASCGGGGGGAATSPVESNSPALTPSVSTPLSAGYPGEPTSCSIADQRLWLNAYMQDQYFWNANLGTPNQSARSIDEYFRSLLFTPIDRYSFSQQEGQFTEFFNAGSRTGYGYSLAFPDESQNTLKFRVIEPLSPAAAAGLKRGDTLLAIDGFSASDIMNGALTSVTTAGITRTFTIETSTGQAKTITLVSRNFALSPVLVDRVFTSANGSKVGYFAYQDFTPSSLSALGQTFNRFRAANITELIVDLRYNSGGSVVVSRALASMIGGPSLEGQVFASIRYNPQNRNDDFDYLFTASPASLPAAPLAGLAQVFFITSPNTASASELVINSLFPFKKVVTVGATTFGKPYGFLPRSACDTTYSAVNFETFNAAGNGRFNNGIAATCSAPDDLSKALGDPTEARTAAALGFIQTNSCPVVRASLQSRQFADQQIRAQEATTNIASRRWLEPAFGEVSKPAMIAD